MESSAKHLCGRCDRVLPVAIFATNPRLHGGLLPWCDLCLAAVREMPVGPERAQAVEAYHAEYRALYQRAAREVKGRQRREKLRFDVDGALVTATMIHRSGRLRLEGPWRALDSMIEVLKDELGCDPSEIEERGFGAGSGRRRQKKARVEGEVTREVWDGFRQIKAQAKPEGG